MAKEDLEFHRQHELQKHENAPMSRPLISVLRTLKTLFVSVSSGLVLLIAAGICLQTSREASSGSQSSEEAPIGSRVVRPAPQPAPPINPSHPNATEVTASALSAAPGAIVCQDYATVQLVFRIYTAHWQDSLQDRLTKGQSKLLRGESSPEPVPEVYGCMLVPPGTSMLQDPGNVVPVVTFKRSDGSYFKGVTMAPMIRK